MARNEESKVEKYFKDEMKRIGGLSFKWTSPGTNGVPDQIAFHDHRVYLAEIKTLGGILSPAQLRLHAKLASVGIDVWTLRGKEDVDLFTSRLEEWKHVDVDVDSSADWRSGK